ncbi:MAG: hypothetical protein ABL874_08215 [Sphingopyxis sp.]
MTRENVLKTLVRDELSQGVLPQISEMAAAIAAQHPGARAVLFYGSCLREAKLDGLMLDFYLIVEDYRTAYRARWLSIANRLIPPNVFPFAHGGLSAKYAVLSMADFTRECGLHARSVSVWARFAQPSRLVWAKDETVMKAVSATVAEASVTLFQRTLPVMPGEVDFTNLDIWLRGFALTYGAELRAERGNRSAAIVTSNAQRYDCFGSAVLREIAISSGVGPNGEVALWKRTDHAAREWRWLQRKGKLLTVLRLAKATFTFAGGIDYLAWKINRHAGTHIAITPWQRRHPILAGLLLVPRLLGQGAVK